MAALISLRLRNTPNRAIIDCMKRLLALAAVALLHQMPCYCRCDLGMGHNSLHSCFEGLHGAECSTCMKEAAFTYQQTKLHKTPAQIRAAIEKGDWMNLDLEHISL